MADYKATNNAYSTLASGINDSVTTFSVQSGHGARFPAITGSDYTYITLENAAGLREIVKVTAHTASSDTFQTVVRGQQGTSALSWSSGDAVELRMVASLMEDAINSRQLLDATLTALAGVTVAANKLIYATGADTFTTTDLTAAGRALLDDADAAAQRTTLELGTIATQAANSVAITGGTINGTTVGATTAATGKFTTLEATQTIKGASTISVGGATPAASGAGITFPASASASSDANTLDDYEEGTWTPSVGGNATYTSQSGTYTKIGRSVTILCFLTINVIGTGSPTTISGLPFASANSNHGAVIFGSSAVNVNVIQALSSGSTAVLYSTTAAQATMATNNVMGNSTNIQFTLTYDI